MSRARDDTETCNHPLHTANHGPFTRAVVTCLCSAHWSLPPLCTCPPHPLGTKLAEPFTAPLVQVVLSPDQSFESIPWATFVNVAEFVFSSPCFRPWEAPQCFRCSFQLFPSTPHSVHISTKLISLTSFSITVMVNKVDDSWMVFLLSKDIVASPITR